MHEWQQMMESNPSAWLTASLAAIVILVVIVIVLWINLMSFKKRFKLLMRGATGQNIEKQLDQHVRLVEEHKKLAEENKERMAAIESTLRQCLQYVGVIRYNAFDDVGSKLSYSIAILNDWLDGLIVTGIYGRFESTIYAKEIKKGASEQHLSVEEKDALNRAKAQQQGGRNH